MYYFFFFCFLKNVFLSKLLSVMGYGGCPQNLLLYSFLPALLFSID